MSTLSFGQIEDLWTKNGGNPMAAPVMAAIALAESGGRTDALNTKPPDYSVGLWQVNYYGSLGPSRTSQYGAPAQLASDPDAQAKAAISISGNGSNLRPWSTYTSGAYRSFLSQNAIPALPNVAQPPGGPTLETAAQGESYDEGVITMPSVIPNIPRALLRRVAGGAVLVGAALVGGAGLFLLLGRRAPGPSRIVQEVIRSRTARETAQTRQEGLLQRQQDREQAERRRESESVTPAQASEEPF